MCQKELTQKLLVVRHIGEKEEFLVKNTMVSKPERVSGRLNLLRLKHFPCITLRQDTQYNPNQRGPWE